MKFSLNSKKIKMKKIYCVFLVNTKKKKKKQPKVLYIFKNNSPFYYLQ